MLRQTPTPRLLSKSCAFGPSSRLGQPEHSQHDDLQKKDAHYVARHGAPRWLRLRPNSSDHILLKSHELAPIRAGMTFLCCPSSWVCSVFTTSKITKIHGLQLSSAISKHQLSSFPTRALLRRVTLSSLTNSLGQASPHPPLCPSSLSSKLSGLLLFSSTMSLAPSWRSVDFLLAIITSVFLQVGPARRPLFLFSFCLSLSSCMKEVSPGRHVLRDSCVHCMFPCWARIPAKSQYPWPFSHLRKEIRGRCPSLPCPANCDCSAATGLPPTPAIPLPPYLPHPRLPSLPSLVPQLP